MIALAPFLIVQRLGRASRLFCALAVAIVTTFHVCDAAARFTDGVTALAEAGGASPQADYVVVEKCHVCAVVSLPAIAAGEAPLDVVRAIPSGRLTHIAAFSRPAVGPPPRA